jgi:hypothetical protein
VFTRQCNEAFSVNSDAGHVDRFCHWDLPLRRVVRELIQGRNGRGAADFVAVLVIAQLREFGIRLVD